MLSPRNAPTPGFRPFRSHTVGRPDVSTQTSFQRSSLRPQSVLGEGPLQPLDGPYVDPVAGPGKTARSYPLAGDLREPVAPSDARSGSDCHGLRIRVWVVDSPSGHYIG